MITTDDVVKAIASGADTFCVLCERLATRESFRVVDRALQRARKRGAVRYDRKRGAWVVTQTGSHAAGEKP